MPVKCESLRSDAPSWFWQWHDRGAGRDRAGVVKLTVIVRKNVDVAPPLAESSYRLTVARWTDDMLSRNGSPTALKCHGSPAASRALRVPPARPPAALDPASEPWRLLQQERQRRPPPLRWQGHAPLQRSLRSLLVSCRELSLVSTSDLRSSADPRPYDLGILPAQGLEISSTEVLADRTVDGIQPIMHIP